MPIRAAGGSEIHRRSNGLGRSNAEERTWPPAEEWRNEPGWHLRNRRVVAKDRIVVELAAGGDEVLNPSDLTLELHHVRRGVQLRIAFDHGQQTLHRAAGGLRSCRLLRDRRLRLVGTSQPRHLREHVLLKAHDATDRGHEIRELVVALLQGDVDVRPAAVRELRELDDRVVGDIREETDHAQRDDNREQRRGLPGRHASQPSTVTAKRTAPPMASTAPASPAMNSHWSNEAAVAGSPSAMSRLEPGTAARTSVSGLGAKLAAGTSVPIPAAGWVTSASSAAPGAGRSLG